MTLINIEIAINPPVTPRTISGFTLTPLVSSSKNLNNPALEAGNGAFFFLLLNSINFSTVLLKYISFDLKTTRDSNLKL